ncbi:MAG: NAD(P)-dependent oxidoreductase [Spirochaetes bacterium]|nr:NAD(P)-dependent oxidoreductase [Spirochaetota bacterium]
MILILNPTHNRHSPGPSIHAVLQELSSSFMVSMSDGDFASRDSLLGLLREYRPKIAINCIEYDDCDAAEYERERAYAINGFSLKNLSDLCREQDVMLIHLSTSLVFNGSGPTPCGEDDDPCPDTVYGDSKLLGERFIAQSGCRHLIIRVTDMFGEHIPFFSGRLAAMDGDSSLRVIRGQVVAPAYSADLARAVLELAGRGCEGLYHFSQGSPVATADFMARAAELFLRHGVTDKKYAVEAIEKEDFLAPCDRPDYNVLDAGKLARAAGGHIRSWDGALEEYVAKNVTSIVLS